MLTEASLLVALSVHHGSGTEACLAEARLSRGVERRLRRKVFVEPARAQLRFVVTYERRGAEIEARIDVLDPDGRARGTRSLVTSSHCSALDDSLALSLALLVEQPPEPEPEPAAQPQPTPEQRRATSAAPIVIPEDVASPREPWHASVGLSATGIAGALPGIQPGLSLSVRVVPRHFYPVSLAGEMFARAEAERDATSGASFRLLRVGLSLCPPLWQRGPHSLGICVGQKLGWLEARGFGFDHALRERRLTFAFALGGEGTLRLAGPLSLGCYAGVEVPLVRDSFASNGRNSAELFRPWPVAAAAEIGIQAALW